MTTRFEIDLAHPGSTHRSRWDWLLGAGGPRRLGMVAVGGLALVLLVGLGGVLPRYLRYSSDLDAIAKLRQEVAKNSNELDTLRVNLRDLSVEARRQVRWSEMLPALSRRLPDPLKIERVTLSRGAQPQPQPGKPPMEGAGELSLRVEATTPVVPGSSRLLDVANFMAALAQDPIVGRQFQLRTWEIKPAAQQTDPLLHITIGFAEKRS